MPSNNNGNKSSDKSYFNDDEEGCVSGMSPPMHRKIGMRPQTRKKVDREVCLVNKIKRVR